MKRKWYRLSEETPPGDEEVHIWGEKCGIGIALWNKEGKFFVENGEINCDRATHWMPLPLEPRKSRR